MPQRDDKKYCVYIMTNRSRTLYVGTTSNLAKRVWQHKNHVFPGFTSRYRLDRLVYLETYSGVRHAISREKQLKGWSRIKKIGLIVAMNPTWRDLAEDWGTPITPVTLSEPAAGASGKTGFDGRASRNS